MIYKLLAVFLIGTPALTKDTDNAYISFHPDRDTRNGFNLLDLFTGDGIFSRIPQLIIDVIGFFAGLFPAQDNDYDVPEYTPDPDSEPITTTTQANTEKYRIRGRSRRYFI